MMRDNGRIPVPAAWLGGLGVIPFLGLAVVTVLSDAATSTVAMQALVAYGALILTFLGAVHWGVAMSASESHTPVSWSRLTISVLPSLAGWVALALPVRLGAISLAASIALMLWVDIESAARGFLPRWYPRLRWPLSSVAVGALLVAGFVGRFA